MSMSRVPFAAAGDLAALVAGRRHKLRALIVSGSADATITLDGGGAGSTFTFLLKTAAPPTVLPDNPFGWIEGENGVALTIAGSAGTISGLAIIETTASGT